MNVKRSIRAKAFASILFAFILIVSGMMFAIRKTLTNLEYNQVLEREQKDINVLMYATGEGPWHVEGDSLFRGDRLLGDGTVKEVFIEPYDRFDETMGTKCVTVSRQADGSYVMVAGSLRDQDGNSLIGTKLDDKVAQALDKNGEWDGALEIEQYIIYVLYRAVYADGQTLPVGCVGVARDISELKRGIQAAQQGFFNVLLIFMLFVAISFGALLFPWLKGIERTNKYLIRIQNGELPSDPLEIKTGDEMQEMAHNINAMVISLREKQRMGAELNIAREIQASMLPCTFPFLPDVDEFDVYARMTPAKEIGGDFYDFFQLNNGKIGLVVADVSGKGVPAALVMMTTKTLVKSNAYQEMSPKQILHSVNKVLCDHNEAEMFVTLWVGILDLKTGVLTAANAGHEYPVLSHNGGDFTIYKDQHGLPLGSLDADTWEEYEIQMGHRDKLFLYTDGVTEATDSRNELFGMARLIDTLNHAKNRTPAGIIDSVEAQIGVFVGKVPQFDDITMMAIEYKRKD